MFFNSEQKAYVMLPFWLMFIVGSLQYFLYCLFLCQNGHQM